MSKVTIRVKNGELHLDTYAVRRLLFSAEVRKALVEVAEPIAKRAGAGHEVETFNGFDRVHASIKTSTKESSNKSLQNNNLLKAVGK